MAKKSKHSTEINYVIFRVNQTEDFSKDFHIYRLEWLLDGIRFYIDDELIGQVNPPNPGGFWELGKFEQGPNPNPWLNRTIMAPFDQKVDIFLSFLCTTSVPFLFHI